MDCPIETAAEKKELDRIEKANLTRELLSENSIDDRSMYIKELDRSRNLSLLLEIALEELENA